MPDSNWRYIVAVLGCLTVSNVAQDDHLPRHHTRGQSLAPQLTGARTPVVRDAAPEQPQSIREECRNSSRTPGDCTQVSARAAVDQARYAFWQAVAAGIGVAIGALTLLAAFAAAKWAKAAAKYTQAGSIAAQSSADAFIKVEDASLLLAFPTGHAVTGSSNYFSLHAVVTNVGRSTALIHSVAFGDDDPVLMNASLAAGEARRFDNWVHVKKVDGEPSPLVTVISYSTALRKKANLKITAAVLIDRKANVPWAFITKSEWAD